MSDAAYHHPRSLFTALLDLRHDGESRLQAGLVSSLPVGDLQALFYRIGVRKLNGQYVCRGIRTWTMLGFAVRRIYPIIKSLMSRPSISSLSTYTFCSSSETF